MSDLDTLAEVFLQIFRTGRLPEGASVDLTHLSLDEAYEVQRRVIERRVDSGERRIGHKVGCTSNAIRRQFGLVEPINAWLMEPHVFHGDVRLNLTDCPHCAIEPEFVLSMKHDVTAVVVDERELVSAIEWAAPGIEIHQYRFYGEQPTSQELIASNGIHVGIVVGSERINPAEVNFDLEGVGAFRNDELVASGIGAEIMGGPLRSLKWLANRLLARNEPLRAGQLVIPGSAVELVPVNSGDNITAAFTTLGSVTAKFRS